jgi:hypothetical protein
MLKSRYFVLTILATVLLSTAIYGQSIKGTYAIKNLVTGMLLRPLDANNKNETPIVAYSPTNWKCMTWDFNQIEGNTYYLRNLLTSKTFKPRKGAITDGVSLEQQPLNETDKLQQWEFLPVGRTSFLIRLKDTEYYVTPSEETGTTNSKIILAGKRTDSLQYWTIYQQHPTM